jgi:four helix bundle protein
MNKEELRVRMKKFALNVILVTSELPRKEALSVITKQLIRCSTSVGANYRAACRAKSKADFINKLKIVEEEADESAYFLDLLKELKTVKNKQIELLLKEANELVSIIVASLKTIKKS